MRRADLDAMLADPREAAAIDPVHPERFYKAYRQDRGGSVLPLTRSD